MRKRGFTLIELIVGLAIIGLISTVGFPIINNSFMNYARVKQEQHMAYLCEMTVERLRGKDSALDNIFSTLESSDEVIVSQIGLTHLENYKCKITKIKESEFTMNLAVKIFIDNEMRNKSYVEYKTVIKK